MPYIFPKRALADTDVLDPIDMNADLIPAAEKYSGKLNAHDFRDLSASVVIASEGYYTPHHTYVEFDHGAQHNFQQPTSVNALKIENSPTWQPIIEDTYITNQCMLWVSGQVLYSGVEWAGGAPLAPPPRKIARAQDVQFAISVDGRVLDWTKTGKRNDFDKEFFPLRATTQRSAGAETAGPAPISRDWARGMGPSIHPVRLTAVVPLGAGNHTIAIVARRLAPLSGTALRDHTDFTVVYNRRLFGLEVPSYPDTATTASVADVPTFEPQDTLDAAGMAIGRIDVVRDAYNDVQEGALARGALNHNHLPSALAYGDQVAIAPIGSFVTDAHYPGFGVDTFAANLLGDTGWWRLDEGGTASGAPTDPLRVLGSGGGTIDVTAGPIIVLANLEVPVITVAGNAHNNFGMFTLGYKATSGTEHVLASTEMVVNSFNMSSDAGNVVQFAIHTDVPLMFVHEVGDGLLPDTIDYFQVYASSANGNGITPVDLSWQRGNLIVLQLRA